MSPTRYVLHQPIAEGGMATVHLASLLGGSGFSRLVAVKRLHPHYARQPEFVAMLLDEAHLAARIRHANVVTTVDVAEDGGDVFLVMEYVDGDSLDGITSALRDRGERAPLPIVTAILGGALRGLQAAHDARAADGTPLSIVHRDVSPHNILVGSDGVPRVADFGIALATVRLQQTRDGQVKGKLGYMAPEQLTGDFPTTAQTDVYATGVVAWELLAGRRAFRAEPEGRLIGRIVAEGVPRLDAIAPDLPSELVDVVMSACARDPARRPESALAMASALERAVPPASAREVGIFVETVAASRLSRRRDVVRAIEAGTASTSVAPLPPSSAQGRTFTGSRNVSPGIAPGIHEAPTRVEGTPPRSASSVVLAGDAVPDPTLAPKGRRRLAWGVGLGVAAITVAGLGVTVLRADAAPSLRLARGLGDVRVDLSVPVAAQTSSAAPSAAASSASATPPLSRTGARGPGVKPDRCDPPTYPDPNDPTIRRVKRECFGR